MPTRWRTIAALSGACAATIAGVILLWWRVDRRSDTLIAECEKAPRIEQRIDCLRNGQSKGGLDTPERVENRVSDYRNLIDFIANMRRSGDLHSAVLKRIADRKREFPGLADLDEVEKLWRDDGALFEKVAVLDGAPQTRRVQRIEAFGRYATETKLEGRRSYAQAKIQEIAADLKNNPGPIEVVVKAVTGLPDTTCPHIGGPHPPDPYAVVVAGSDRRQTDTKTGHAATWDASFHIANAADPITVEVWDRCRLSRDVRLLSESLGVPGRDGDVSVAKGFSRLNLSVRHEK